MNATYWIGICGPIASGKSYAATWLQEALSLHGLRVITVPFAAAVKYIASLAELPAHSHTSKLDAIETAFMQWGASSTAAREAALSVLIFAAQHQVTPGIKNRRLLQYIGTEVGRVAIGENIWVSVAAKTVRSGTYDVVISDDLRFDNEAEAVDFLVGVDVKTNESLYKARIEDLGALYTFSDHPSENSLTKKPEYLLPIGFERSDILALAQRIVTERNALGPRKGTIRRY